MAMIFLLNGLSYISVALFSFWLYYSFFSQKGLSRKAAKVIGVNGIFYLIFGILNFAWSLNLVLPNEKDFGLLNTGLVIVSSVLIVYCIHIITQKKSILYLLIAFVMAMFAVSIGSSSSYAIALATSFVLTAIIFVELASFSNFYLKIASYFGMGYSLTSLLLVVLLFQGYRHHMLFWFIPNSMLALVVWLLYLDVKSFGIYGKKKKTKKTAFFYYAAPVLRYIIFISCISAFMLLSTVSIHELGHALSAQYYGCSKYKAVIYDTGPPHTEILCESYYNDLVISLAGLAASLVAVLVFVVIDNEFTKEIAYLMFGFGFLISYSDLKGLGISESILLFIALLALIIIAVSTVSLSAYYLKQQHIFRHGFGNSSKRHYSGKEAESILTYE